MATNNSKKKRTPRKDYHLFTINDIQVEEGFNPRHDYGDIEELARDVASNGILVPLRGFKRKGEDKYILTDGHRRFKAAQIVQKKYPNIELRIPLIAHKVITDEQRLLNVLSFNSGLNLNPLEEAEVINRLVNFGLNDKEIIKRTGMTGTYVSNLKLLYNSPQSLKNHVTSNMVSATLAMEVLREAKDFEKASKIIEEGVSFAKAKGKDKVVKKDLQQSQGKVNSYSALGKCFKSAKKENRAVRDDKKELYDFSLKILNGEFTKEQLEEYFFKPNNQE